MTKWIISVIRNMIMRYQRALTGTKSQVRAHPWTVGLDPAAGVDGIVIHPRQAGKNTITHGHLRRLYEQGLIRQEPTCEDDGMRALDEVMRVRLYADEIDLERGPVIQSPVRRFNEIVCCPLCGHPRHDSENGLCAFLSAPEGNPPEQPVCLCGSTDHPEPDDHSGCSQVREHDPAYNDLQDYLEGDTATAQAAARRLDQRAVDQGQLSPRQFRETWGDLPRRTYEAHKIWCVRHRDHDVAVCPVWGDE